MDTQSLSKYMYVPFPDVFVLSCSSRVQLYVTLLSVAPQALLSMGVPSPEYWSELHCPPAGHLSDPGREPASPVSPAWRENS